MGNNITDRLKYKESIVKFSRKYGVAKAAYKFGECKRTIYRWRKILSIYSNRLVFKIKIYMVYKCT